MTAEPRKIHRRPAGRPAARTVSIVIDSGPYEGWEATARADFPARLLADLASGSPGRIIGVLQEIVVDHNFPRPPTAAELKADKDAGDQVAKSMGDVDYSGLVTVAGEIFDAIGKLPSR